MKVTIRPALASLLLAAVCLVMTSALQVAPNGSRHASSTALDGLFDSFINSMEAGYKGEDSAFQKQKAADEAKRAEQKKRADARKARGFTELKDVKERTFAKTKYDAPPEKPQEKKLFGLF